MVVFIQPEVGIRGRLVRGRQRTTVVLFTPAEDTKPVVEFW